MSSRKRYESSSASGPAESEYEYAITDAQEAHSKDVSHRMINYAITMGIRMVCFVVIFFVPGWWKLVPILGAVFLPFVAVVFANAGRERNDDHADALLEYAPHDQLGATPAAPTGGNPSTTAAPGSGPAGSAAPGTGGRSDDHWGDGVTLIDGEVVDDAQQAGEDTAPCGAERTDTGQASTGQANHNRANTNRANHDTPGQ